MTLSPEGQAILRELVKHMKEVHVIPDDPRTFAGYKQIHDALGLERRADTYGDSLKVQGLADLAEWAFQEGHPAVTGLVVDQAEFTPGKGYYRVNRRREDDFTWWKREVELSLSYDWARFLPTSAPPRE